MRETALATTRDLKFALRNLKRNPGFTLVALLTLALGLGANSAIYSLVHASLFRAPAVEDPEELVAVYTTSRRGFPRSSTSYPDFVDYRSQATLLEDLVGTTALAASLGDESRGSRFITVEAVTGSFFRLIGVDARLGRILTESDDRLRAGERVIVLSNDLWRTHFLSDPGIVGRDVRLNGQAFTVVGVTPPSFRGLSLSAQTDVWMPMQSAAFIGQGSIANDSIWEQRGNRWMGMAVGRMVEGASVDQVRAQFHQISEGLKVEWPEERGPRNTTVDHLASYLLPNGAETEVTQLVWLLFGVVGLTLLLACANLANLMLARATGRVREIAVRLALGAKRTQLIRQLLIESTALAVLGGLLGLGLGTGMVELLGGFELPGGIRIDALGATVNAPVLLFTAGVSLLTGVVFGLAPALQASRPEVANSLKGESMSGAVGAGKQLRKALVAAQIALCFILLIGSGLFVRTLREGMSADLGFDPQGVALARVNLGLLNYEAADGMAFLDEVRTRLESLPGISAVSTSTRVPLQNGGARGFFVKVRGYEPAPDEEMRIDMIAVSPGYFESLGLPILEGRPIEGSDAIDDQGASVVINRAMAERYWGGESPIGRTISLSGNEMLVVGVAKDATWLGLSDEPTNYVYAPLTQLANWSTGFITVAARTEGDAEATLGILRTEITALEPDAPISFLHTMEDQVRDVLSAQELGAALLSAFGLLALLLSSVGIAGVITYTVNQQRKDIGIRMALGARRASVMSHIARGMTIPVAVGILIGFGGAWSLTRSIEGFLFGVEPTDTRTYVVVTGVLLAVAVAAAVFPTRGATQVDPMEVLKSE